MAAGRSPVTPTEGRRAAGAERVQGSGSTVAVTAAENHTPTLESLDEMSKWLGTYRERLRLARRDESLQGSVLVARLGADSRDRREQLA